MLAVRLTPRAARDGFGGIREGEDGASHLVVRVTSPPVDGAANAALVKLIGKSLHVPRSALTIVSGTASRRKVIEITGDPAALERTLEAATASNRPRHSDMETYDERL